MKKAFDQTVRDIKREVNKKVLKVPSSEQKVLDATSNEPWGPHGSLLADIANATRNHYEYQMIMSVIWKRTNDYGKNWRHVYKALTVLEYLVAHGPERVIDDIREHAYQISTLSDFQYIDSSGKDQGNNVRKKSQSLVVLVNDKERIQEVRQKAAANRDKYRSSPVGGMYRPSSGGYGDRYDDGRYGNRDDDRNIYGREREWGSRDNDRYGRESYGGDGDMYGRARSSQDGYRDDDYRGKGPNDDYSYGSSRSADRDRSRSNEDNGQHSPRGSGATVDDQSQDGRDGDPSVGYAPKASSPKGASPSHPTSLGASPSAPASPPALALAPVSASAIAPAQHTTQNNKAADGFNPRGSFSAPVTSNGAISGAEPDLLGSLSEFALVLVSQSTNASLDNNSGPAMAAATSLEATINNQAFDDPFGNGPFKAISLADSVSTQQHIPIFTNTFNINLGQNLDVPKQVPQKVATEFGGNPYETTYVPSGPSPPSSTQFVQKELSNPIQELDILADILPPSSQFGYQVPPNQSVPHAGFPQPNQAAPQTGFLQSGPQSSNFQSQLNQLGQNSYQTGYPRQSQTDFPVQGMALTYPVQGGQTSQMGFQPQSDFTQSNPSFYGVHSSQLVSTGSVGEYMAPPTSTVQNNFRSESGCPAVLKSRNLFGPTSVNASLIGSSMAPQPSKDKFETKSTVWADTLSRGLVNLNISGPKTNPLADIGVDFDAINRKEKRMEKPTTAAVASTVIMGKAMGSGSGIGRAGATALRPPANPTMGPGPGMGQSGGRGMMNMPGNVGTGMNTQQPIGAYNFMGTGGYGQQPYGGGYR